MAKTNPCSSPNTYVCINILLNLCIHIKLRRVTNYVRMLIRQWFNLHNKITIKI